MQSLKLVHPGQPYSPTRVDVDLRLDSEDGRGGHLYARFQVSSDRPASLNPELGLDGSQWGLWDWDVVELFVTCSRDPSRLPYYEFQVSPLGQHFELEILEPRKQINRDFRSGFKHSARRAAHQPGAWEAELSIPLDRLDWDGDPASIRGNAYGILGPKEARTYWSLFLEPQAKPDFHLPLQFKPLLPALQKGSGAESAKKRE